MSIVSFLQELLKAGHTPSMVKVDVVAFTAHHPPIVGQSMGRNDLIVRFLKGGRRLNPPHPHTIPNWDLSTILRALRGPPFQLLQPEELQPLSLKTAL